ncbi:MAG: DUF3072 domain-containing protein [Pseudonocardiales bacterium]|nr:DUF3072 domain-containing protein [Pseudonocardiales bacterium]MBV9031059.1 DUF3072 domain-containing protein [Pseudonocardiales bacterium]MBW0011238.1 DUF3072 domain-containing protein [Pseudonocardiales bacterium]
MTDAVMGSPEKDPDDWVTGDEPMTGPQHSYLKTLAREAGEDVPDDLTKAQASELIDRLREKTGRGRQGSGMDLQRNRDTRPAPPAEARPEA